MALKLRYAPASPFVRKVLVFAHEAGLASEIEKVPTDVWDPASDIVRDNPLGRVPVLVSDDGTFVGSTLCCEYLDSLHTGRRLIPVERPARWKTLQVHSIADGMIEAAVACVVEQLRRPKDYVFAGQIDRQLGKVQRSLDFFERDTSTLDGEIDLASITLGCGLAYLDFRLSHVGWRDRHPRLAAWNGRMAALPSMVGTEFPRPAPVAPAANGGRAS